eukprot:GHRR01021997.1.p1 GENE.GHRR01021997.1~~GHRR01021997.1.p1  ORF type:complete len:270 (+),score=84.39 GHRR01021997.1:545-1354(+)
MLLQCEQRAQQNSQCDWKDDSRFHCLVDALQERLFGLEQSTVDRPSPDVVQLYKAHVEAIVNELRQPELPAYCLRTASKDRQASSSAQQLHRVSAAASADSIPNATSDLLFAARVTDEPILVRQKTSSAMGSARQLTTMPASIGAAATAANSPPSFSLGDSGRDKLRTQQRLQDELTDELLDMGQELKATSLSMHNAIRYRGKLLEDAGDALDDSAANAKSIAAKTKQQYDRSSSSLCQTCLILVVVALMFSTMIVWIKLTSMVGIHGI